MTSSNLLVVVIAVLLMVSTCGMCQDDEYDEREHEMREAEISDDEASEDEHEPADHDGTVEMDLGDSTTDELYNKHAASLLHRACERASGDLLKEEDHAVEFCKFVDHLFEKHRNQIVGVLQKTLDNEDILQYSMAATVRWRRASHVDDEHLIGSYFMDRLHHYISEQSIHHKDEL